VAVIAEFAVVVVVLLLVVTRRQSWSPGNQTKGSRSLCARQPQTKHGIRRSKIELCLQNDASSSGLICTEKDRFRSRVRTQTLCRWMTDRLTDRDRKDEQKRRSADAGRRNVNTEQQRQFLDLYENFRTKEQALICDNLIRSRAKKSAKDENGDSRQLNCEDDPAAEKSSEKSCDRLITIG
jgi:hypothetical protein